MRSKKTKTTLKKSINLKAQAAKVKKLKQQLKLAESKVKLIVKKGEQKIKAAQVQLKSRAQRAETKVKEIKVSLERLEKSPKAATAVKTKAKTANAKKGKKMVKRSYKPKAVESNSEMN